MSRHRPVGDAHDRITFQHPGEDGRASRIDWHKEAQLPRNDLAEQTVGTQPVAHRLGEAGQFDADGTHHADTAKLGVSVRSMITLPSSNAVKAASGVRFEAPASVAAATHAGETMRPTMRSPVSVCSR